MNLKKNDFKDPGDLILNESFREFVEGTNPESVREWENWIAAHPDEKETFGIAIDVLKTLLNKRKDKIPVDKNISLSNLMRNIDKDQPQPGRVIESFNSIWFRIAAVSLLVIGLASIWNTIHISGIKNKDIAYNEVIVPLGEKAQIILSDGSHVWINSASKLKYPVQFGEDSRDVMLEGEAFFDVVKKTGKTFVVNTRDVKVNVLGTAFNVKCYPGDKKTQTLVVRGEVRVEVNNGSQEPIIIKPNEMATLKEKVSSGPQSTQSSSLTVNKVEPENLISWKDQLLVFAGESFEDLAVKMERWYNVKIRINNEELKSERFNGKFVHNETVYQVLEAIKITTPITYTIEKDTIIISKIKRK